MSKVLIAEDDAFLANAYRVKLTKAGFDVRMAMNGKEALQTLEEFSPDIILLDLVMPVLDGFSTLAEIKKNDKWKKIPVIISSNLGQKEDIEKGKNLGATDYIVKSNISINDLADKINEVLHKK